MTQQQEAPRRAEDVLAELEDLLTVGLLEQAINGSVLSWGEAALVAHRIARHLRAALAAVPDPDHNHLHIGTAPRVELEPIWSCMGCGQATNTFVTGSLVHPEIGLCQRCVDAIRAAPDPDQRPLDVERLRDAVQACLVELSESPLPGARYAYEVVRRRFSAALSTTPPEAPKPPA